MTASLLRRPTSAGAPNQVCRNPARAALERDAAVHPAGERRGVLTALHKLEVHRQISVITGIIYFLSCASCTVLKNNFIFLPTQIEGRLFMSASPEALIQAPPRSLPRIGEDWLSVIIGLAIFVLALAGLANVDLIGWAVTTSVWVT